MRVLNVTVSLNPKGGGWPERTIQMSCALAEAGVECSILTFDEALDYWMEGVEINTIPTRKRGPKLTREMPVGSLKKIQAQVAETDVVHLMGFRSLLNAVVFRYAKKLGKKVVICPAGSIPSYGSLLNRTLKWCFDLAIGNSMVRDADACIAVTNREKEALIAHGFDASKARVMSNAVFRSDFMFDDPQGFRSKYGLGNKKFILFLGRLAHIKGPDLLLKAFAGLPERLRDRCLVFAGPDAGMRTVLETMTEELGMKERVHFLGLISQPDKSHAYHAAELVVVPSRQEAMSIVALEAGISGTPVLITDACGFDELAGVDCRLISATSVDSLRDRLEKLLPDTSLKELGERISRWIENEYSWERMTLRYIEFYRQLIGGTP